MTFEYLEGKDTKMIFPEMNVPCIMINNENYSLWWPHISKCLCQCDFISIDLELSGLGPKEIFANQIDQRYKVIREVASTRSILSMGIACFKINPNKGFFKKQEQPLTEQQKFVLEQINDCLDDELPNNNNCLDHLSEKEKDDNFYTIVNVFNFLTLNTNGFVMEARSMKFLVQQGFDFNELSLKGIPFCPGNDSSEASTPPLRRLINLIISLKLPIVIHNGFLDLAFLYHNFYAEIPKRLETFQADLFEMFPEGIFDTKFIANTELKSSYLEYLFQYSQRFNYFCELKKLPCLKLEFTEYGQELSCHIKTFDLSSKIMKLSLDDNNQICENYSKYGWCDKLDNCEQSHNIDLILDEELKSKKDMISMNLISHLKKMNAESELQDGGDDGKPTPQRKSGSHHSGNDAFMTGYFFLFNYINHNRKFKNCNYAQFKQFSTNFLEFKNKVFLSCKPRPLHIMKSSYTTNSINHKTKFQIIKQKSDWR